MSIVLAVSLLYVQTRSVLLIFFLKSLWLGDKNVSFTSLILSRVISESIISLYLWVWLLVFSFSLVLSFIQIFVGLGKCYYLCLAVGVCQICHLWLLLFYCIGSLSHIWVFLWKCFQCLWLCYYSVSIWNISMLRGFEFPWNGVMSSKSSFLNFF